MHNSDIPKVAIVDYGMGNLYSVKHACAYMGLMPFVTFSKKEILSSDAVILPGVGAFGDAIEALKKLDLIQLLHDVALSDKTFIGICLGMQLLMSESQEFGHYKGLDVVNGEVVRFHNPVEKDGKRLKIPHIGWNRIYRVKKTFHQDLWEDSFLAGLVDDEFMYFVHSFYVKPKNPSITLSISSYGNVEFCSALQYQNIFACQFHPERSGPKGLEIFRNISTFIKRKMKRM